MQNTKFYQKWEAGILDSGICNEYFPAEVPGNVQRDYAKHIGILENLHFGTTAKALEAVEDCTWLYRAFLEYDEKTGNRVFFVAEGIDYIFDILIDGKVIKSQEGMYTKTEIDITDIAHNGSLLEVKIFPHPKAKGSVKNNRFEASDSCKPPMCYGWDWNPRLLISGIWLPAYIELRAEDYINCCEPKYDLDIEKLTAKIKFDISCSVQPKITLSDPDGKVIYTGYENTILLENVRLWWCNGQGEPELYSWKAETPNDVKEGKIGFKTLKLVRNEGCENEKSAFPKSQLPAPITIELNGRRIFAKGTNYVNADIFPANVRYQSFYELVTAAQEANMNIIRIWGGAGCVKPEFYDLCDENGILVWQEFMLACNDYKATEHYMPILEKEAISIIENLRSHVSLAFWCGGNELFNSWSGMDEQSLPLRLLNKLCYEYDRNRPFIMTSPITGMAHGNYVFTDIDGTEVFTAFLNAGNTAYSEFGVPSIAPVEQLKKIIPEDEIFPIEPTESWVYHHAFNAWRPESWAHLETLEKYFGEASSIEEIVENSQFMQSQGYKALFEEGRRQWSRCAMTLNWCYNEPWVTAANNSLISYPNVKKPAYYAVKESLRNVMPSARIPKFSWENGEMLSFELWYHNDSTEIVNDEIKAVVRVGEDEYDLLTWETNNIPSGTNKQGPTVNFILPENSNANRITISLISLDKNKNNEYTLIYTYNKPVIKEKILNM